VLPYLWVFGASAAVSFLTTPLVLLLSRRLGWIDRPSDRKVHPKPTPTVGGLAIFLGVTAGLGVSRIVPFLSRLHETTSDVEAALLGALVVFSLGVIDDTRGVSALGKLAGQTLAAGILVLLGVQLLFFYFPGQGIVSLDPTLAIPLTVLWVVGMVNAVNLIDGLDGLAAGMIAIGAIAFFLYMSHAPGVEAGPTVAALLSAVVAGSAIGFLPWNFWPARIFMGDSGAMLLGLLMAVASISGVGRNISPSGGDFAAFAIPIAVPLLILAIPLLDVVFAIARRMRRGSGITHADKEHVHHRLMDIGHSHRTAVLLMYLWSALISASALAVAFINGRLLVGSIIATALALAVAIPRLVLGRSPLAGARRDDGGGRRPRGPAAEHLTTGPSVTPVPPSAPEPPGTSVRDTA
jgi:UDP-GlcNAc:undecaprenyl-phosphate GlcNAc-1-phosphate transferase